MLQSSESMGVEAVVLAAGRGKRMESDLPKVLHKICGRAMLNYPIETLNKAGIPSVVVVSYKEDLVKKEIGEQVKYAHQNDPTGGTADALVAGLSEISQDVKRIVVLNGDDSAFYRPETIRQLLVRHVESEAVMSFVSLEVENPHGLGRVVRDAHGCLIGIVEEADTSELEKEIKEINIGLYVFDINWLKKNVSKVKASTTGEYYLVDLAKIALAQGDSVSVYQLEDPSQWQGINTPEQLQLANKKMAELLQSLSDNS